MTYLLYGVSVLLGYLLGCSNMAFYLSRLAGVDLRSGGSGNLGASNATLLLGWWSGILVGAHDIGKAALAVVLAGWIAPSLPLAGAAAGVACVLGHMFPFYLRFKGGKGFASYLGMTLALDWKFALVVLAIVVAITLITDYIVIGTVTTTLLVPTYVGISTRDWMLALVLCVASAVILYKHHENYIRIWRGTEIGLRRANRGDDRVRK